MINSLEIEDNLKENDYLDCFIKDYLESDLPYPKKYFKEIVVTYSDGLEKSITLKQFNNLLTSKKYKNVTTVSVILDLEKLKNDIKTIAEEILNPHD